MLRNEEDPQIRVLYDLCSMIFHTLQYPSSITHSLPAAFSSEYPSSSSLIRRNRTSYSSAQISPASFACLFLGISLTLMICGFITFLIGFILMPWIITLVLIFYFAGFLSNLSDFGRSLVIWALSPPDAPAWKHL
ncbi:Protein spaetzle 4 [Bienertia sinuspersici]